MTKFINKNNRGYPVSKDSIQLNDFDTICEVNKTDNKILINGIEFDEMDNMGGSSQVEYYISQHREEDDNDVANDIIPRNNYRMEVLLLIEQMLNSCLNKYLFNNMCQIIRNRWFIYHHGESILRYAILKG